MNTEGLKPISKITSGDLRAAGIIETVKFVRWLAANGHIQPTEWHHTSKHFNETDFWSADDIAEQLASLDLDALRTAFAKPVETKTRWMKVTYAQWEGSRRHGKFETYTDSGIAVGRWVFFQHGKKALDGKHIVVTFDLDGPPSGMPAETVAAIKNRAGVTT